MNLNLVNSNFLRLQSGPLTLEILGHSSVEEFDLESQEPNACLQFADRFHLHRETVPRFYETFIPFVENLTGIPREVDESKTAKKKANYQNPDRGKSIYESPTSYLFRIEKQVSPIQFAAIKDEALRVSRTFKIDVSPATRLSPIEPMYFKRAESLLSAEVETINKKAQVYLSLVSDYELAFQDSGKPQLESLARLMQKYELAKLSSED